jgi:alpha-D-ribose 1-methylphosphonate 5-triphosphate synthase subunit PhnG
MSDAVLPIGLIEPGMLVRNLRAPEWGLGQVQSRIGHRITVNFEEAGKVALDGRAVLLEAVGDDPRRALREDPV